MNSFTPQFGIQPNYDPEKDISIIMQGRFILDGETIYLKTRSGDIFQIDQVTLAASAFNDVDGVLRYPKPFIYDNAGSVIQQGDLLLIAFAESDITNPVVLSPIIPAKTDEFFHEFTRETYQQKRTRFQTDECLIEYHDDGKGEIQLDIVAVEGGTGNITLNLTGFDQNNGNVTINVSGDINVSAEKEVVITALEKAIVDSPLIELGADATEKLVKGNLWATLYKAHVHPTPTGPSGPPTNAAQADSCLSEQNTTL